MYYVIFMYLHLPTLRETAEPIMLLYLTDVSPPSNIFLPQTSRKINTHVFREVKHTHLHCIGKCVCRILAIIMCMDVIVFCIYNTKFFFI